MQWLAISGLALLSVGVVGAWWSFERMMTRAGGRVGVPPADLAATMIEFVSDSGNHLRGWLVRPGVEKPRAIVVLLHGNRDTRRSMVGRARFWRARGCAALLLDLSGHGESEGEVITFGHREALDARSVVALARATYPHTPVVGHGFSLGGAALVLALPELDADGLVLEAVYPDIATAVRNRIVPRHGALNRALTGVLVARLRSRLKLTAADLSPVTQIAHARCPLLIIGGENDPLTTRADTERLHAAAPAEAALWIVPRARHVDFHAFATPEYEARVGEWLEQVVARAR